MFPSVANNDTLQIYLKEKKKNKGNYEKTRMTLLILADKKKKKSRKHLPALKVALFLSKMLFQFSVKY